MADRPYTLLSCAVSLDGYLDSAEIERLKLSNAADFDRVDGLRAASDAVLVGARTVRADDPRLLVRSNVRTAQRVSDGRSPSPLKVTVTRTGDLDPGARFFTTGSAVKLVYCATAVLDATRRRIGASAEIVDAGEPAELAAVLEDLSARGVERLMVEGGGSVLTQLLTGALADELQLVVAPLFVGDSRSCRFVGDGVFPWTNRRRASLASVRQIGDVVLLRYALSERYDDRFADAER